MCVCVAWGQFELDGSRLDLTNNNKPGAKMGGREKLREFKDRIRQCLFKDFERKRKRENLRVNRWGLQVHYNTIHKTSERKKRVLVEDRLLKISRTCCALATVWCGICIRKWMKATHTQPHTSCDVTFKCSSSSSSGFLTHAQLPIFLLMMQDQVYILCDIACHNNS